jgi:ABC-type phosphate/phosphonate transport system substrate-binding protein
MDIQLSDYCNMIKLNGKIFSNRLNFIVTLLFSLLVLNSNLYSQQKLKKSYNLGITKNILEGVNIRDAKVSIEIWVKLLAETIRPVEKINVEIFNNSEELISAVDKNAVDIIYLSSFDYEMEKDRLKIIPLAKTNINKSDFYDIYLCTFSGDNVPNFASLKDKKILVQAGKYKEINELWLNLLCLQNGVKNKDKFFKKVEFVEKPMQAILPVFLKKVDLCIINSGSLEIISELNPQISKSIDVLFKQENLINDIICIRQGLSDEERNLVSKITLNYKSLPKNEQAFKIFKTVGSSAIKKSDFDGIEVLLNNYKKWNGK